LKCPPRLLLRRRRVLPATLRSRGSRAGRCSRAGVAPNVCARNHTARGTTNACAGRCTCRRCWRLGRLLWRRGLGRIEATLLDCPARALRLVLLLLLRVL